jgi:hypothetical protein
MAMNLREEILNDTSKQLSDDIDFEILSGMLVGCGWSKIVLKPMSWERGSEIDLWVENNVKGKFQTRGLVWLFEGHGDATMFALKWA